MLSFHRSDSYWRPVNGCLQRLPGSICAFSDLGGHTAMIQLLLSTFTIRTQLGLRVHTRHHRTYLCQPERRSVLTNRHALWANTVVHHTTLVVIVIEGTGTKCDIDIDWCCSDPCGAAQYCVDGIDSYTCVTPNSFAGTVDAIAVAIEDAVHRI